MLQYRQPAHALEACRSGCDLDNISALRESLSVLAGRNLRASSDPPKSVVLNVDSLPIEVHGHQKLSAYNGHYRYRYFHPLSTRIGEIGASVRPGTSPGCGFRGGEVHTAAMADEMADEIIGEAVELVEHYIAPVRAVRLDAGTTIGQPARCLRGSGGALSGAPSTASEAASAA